MSEEQDIGELEETVGKLSSKMDALNLKLQTLNDERLQELNIRSRMQIEIAEHAGDDYKHSASDQYEDVDEPHIETLRPGDAGSSTRARFTGDNVIAPSLISSTTVSINMAAAAGNDNGFQVAGPLVTLDNAGLYIFSVTVESRIRNDGTSAKTSAIIQNCVGILSSSLFVTDPILGAAEREGEKLTTVVVPRFGSSYANYRMSYAVMLRVSAATLIRISVSADTGGATTAEWKLYLDTLSAELDIVRLGD